MGGGYRVGLIKGHNDLRECRESLHTGLHNMNKLINLPLCPVWPTDQHNYRLKKKKKRMFTYNQLFAVLFNNDVNKYNTQTNHLKPNGMFT